MRKDRTEFPLHPQLRRRTMLAQIRPHGLELCDSAYILETGIIRRVDFADGKLAKDEIGKTYFGDINNH
jgi:hypothetical protein